MNVVEEIAKKKKESEINKGLKIKKNRKGKAPIQIGFSIKQPCNFLFESKKLHNCHEFECIQGRGGISNLKNETLTI